MNIVNWSTIIYTNKSWLSLSIYIRDVYTSTMATDEDSVKCIWNYLQYEGATENIPLMSHYFPFQIQGTSNSVPFSEIVFKTRMIVHKNTLKKLLVT